MIGKDFTYNLKQSKPENLEKLQPISNTKSNLTVGLPKETTFQEKRIALCPNAVKDIAAAGNKVFIEKKARNKDYRKYLNILNVEYMKHSLRMTIVEALPYVVE